MRVISIHRLAKVSGIMKEITLVESRESFTQKRELCYSLCCKSTSLLTVHSCKTR